MSGPHCPLRYKLLVRTVGKMQQRVDVLQLWNHDCACTGLLMLICFNAGNSACGITPLRMEMNWEIKSFDELLESVNRNGERE